jgi:probable HAF family extracellular repeat protein
MHAVLWEQGMIKDLGTLPGGGYQSEANAVNNAGQVVGSALNTTPDANSMAVGNFWYFDVPYGYEQRAFLWDKRNGMEDLGTLPGGTNAQAILINDRGQVVGESYTASTQSGACFPLATSAFIWEKGKGMTDLGGFGGSCTAVAALNNQGQVVGESFRTGDKAAPAFLWENGAIHELGGSLGGDYTGAFAINDQGQVAGFGYLSGNTTYHATLWQHRQTITDLGVVGADPCSYAAAINAKMQVVGASIADCDEEFRAFLWEDGSLFDMNSLIPPASALYLQLTYAINDLGEIAGTGVDSSGNQHAVLLIPCDENHPDIEGCDYSSVDATAAGRVSTMPAVQSRPSANRRNSARRLLGRQPGPLSQMPHPATAEAGDPPAPNSQNFDWHLEDRIAIDDGAALVPGSSLRPVSNAVENSCPAVHCSTDHTKGRVCGAAICHLPGFVTPIFSGYDLTYKRACVYGC